jgi:uncharacterized membrane protein
MVRVLSIIALGLSSYLLWASLAHEHLPGCGLESGCGAVTSSRWSHLFQIPVSLPAVLLYAGVLWATLQVNGASRQTDRRLVEGLLAASGAALVTAAAWFIALQLFVIGSICPFCMAAHACGISVGVILLWRAWNRSPRHDSRATRPAPKGRLALAGLASVALFAVAQVIERPKTFSVTSSPQLTVRKAPRKLQLDGGALQLDLSNVPLHGSPDAACVIVHLFDYSCSHCRALHPILVEACRTMSNQVAVASLPVPMATNCNPLLKRVIPAHINACAYAYCGLAVWRANPAKLSAFDDWIFAPQLPPAPDAAKAEGMRLVGTNELNQALEDPWVREQIDFDIGLYKANYLRYRKDSLPELVIGTNLVAGTISSVDDLYKLLSAQFDIKLPGAQAAGP